MEEIKSTSQVMPIEVTRDGFIVDGNHRYRAMQELGIQTIPVFVGEQWDAVGRLKRPYRGISVDVEVLT